MPDDVRSLSAILAADPASLVYADLAEALRRRGDLDQALRVVMGGLARHPDHADGLDCLGRIHADRGDLGQARDAWTRALALAPEHLGALKGVGFALFRLGDTRGALGALERAVAASPADEGARRALETVRRAGGVAAPASAAAPSPGAATDEGLPEPGIPVPPQTAAGGPAEPGAPDAPAVTEPEDLPPVFRGFEGGTADILLFDDRGLVVAGGLTGPNRADVAPRAAAGLAGVSAEASRTAQYLSLGVWSTIVAETDGANLVLAPVGPGALLLVRRERSVPVGLVLRVAERAQASAAGWLRRQGA